MDLSDVGINVTHEVLDNEVPTGTDSHDSESSSRHLGSYPTSLRFKESLAH